MDGPFRPYDIFDNLSAEGLILEDWIRDFHSLSDEFEITCLEKS
jgi:hypothetical protein